MSVVSDTTIGDRTLDDLWDRPLALDLFAGAGGACRGLQTYGHRRLGWEVIGIDTDPRKVRYYPGVFVKHDLTEGLPEVVDDYADQIEIVWASAPCTFATGLQFARSGENLIPLARDLCQEIDPDVWILENVPGARDHLENPVQLCGSAFGLGVRKHRLFETSFFAHGTPCSHPEKFDYAIGEREAPVTGYRQAHGLSPHAPLPAKALREVIPPAYVHELLDQYIHYAPHTYETTHSADHTPKCQ
jgi:hypothetical protein